MSVRVLLLLILLPCSIFAAPFWNLPTAVVQPDGTTVNLLASGDEYFNYLHDASGYTIIRNPADGWLCYAVETRGAVSASPYRWGAVDPASVGIRPGVRISPEEYRHRAASLYPRSGRDSRFPQTGTVNNLTILIRFSDQDEFSMTRAEYDARFNALDGGRSLRGFFQEASYDQLDLVTALYPVCEPTVNLSYCDPHPRSYYEPYDATTNPDGYTEDERAGREQDLLAAACAAIADQVPQDLDIDADNDGFVDNVCFIIRGPHTAWADLLWAHRWVLFYSQAWIHGVQVSDYTFQPENQNNVTVLCHEMFHSVGAPDLYHYNFDGLSPAGLWDIMESGTGHMSAYMKYRYGGWIDTIPPLTSAGTYTLQPLTSSTGQCYRIPGTGGDSYVLEYRKNTPGTYEDALPRSGLLIWRVFDQASGNADGPPDELYLYRPGGDSQTNGDVVDAPFGSDYGRTSFNANTDPRPWMTYGGTAPFGIRDIGEAGETITFSFDPDPSLFPPTVVFSGLTDGDLVTDSVLVVTVEAEQASGGVASVTLFTDGTTLGTDITPPYSFEWHPEPGDHVLRAVASGAGELAGTAEIHVRTLDPTVPTWFSWFTGQPEYQGWGRGSIPITVAVDFDLGETEYDVQAIALNMEADPWGFPEIPGRFRATIYRMDDGAITDEVLYDLGEFVSDMDGRFEVELADPPVISGEVALAMYLDSYQNMLFDVNGRSGHSWITEPDRPWTDALARGALGAADISMKLVQSGSAADPEVVPPIGLTLSAQPNPFNPETTIVFSIPAPAPVEVTVFNLRGERVKTLLREPLTAGEHRLAWNGTGDHGAACPSGIYFTRIVSGELTRVGKITLLK